MTAVHLLELRQLDKIVRASRSEQSEAYEREAAALQAVAKILKKLLGTAVLLAGSTQSCRPLNSLVAAEEQSPCDFLPPAEYLVFHVTPRTDPHDKAVWLFVPGTTTDYLAMIALGALEFPDPNESFAQKLQ